MNTNQPFYYEFDTASSAYPFLLHANRMGRSSMDQTFCIRRDGAYPFFTIHFLLNGCGFFQVSGQDYLLKGGDAFLINSGEEHLYQNYSAEPLELIWIEFSVTGCPEVFEYFRHHPTPVLYAAHTEKAIRILSDIIETLRAADQAGDPVNEFALSSMYYRFLMELMESVCLQPTRKQPELVQEALNYITLHFRENFSVQELADRLHVSRAYLTRSFNQHVGISPIRYVHMRRLEYACRLLTGSDMTCEQIASEVGMYDASHFNRLFRQNIGHSPSEYREWAKNKITYSL